MEGEVGGVGTHVGTYSTAAACGEAWEPGVVVWDACTGALDAQGGPRHCANASKGMGGALRGCMGKQTACMGRHGVLWVCLEVRDAVEVPNHNTYRTVFKDVLFAFGFHFPHHLMACLEQKENR